MLDGGGNYNDTTYEYTVPDDGFYDFAGSFYSQLRFVPATSGVSVMPIQLCDVVSVFVGVIRIGQ